MISTKTVIRITFNTLLGVVLVIVWLQFVDVKQILEKLQTVNLTILVLVLAFMVLSALIRSFRLKVFLKPIKQVNILDLFYLGGVAMMLNFFIPIRGGDIAKGLYLSKNYELSVGKSVIWIFLDRFLDFFASIFLSSLLLLFVPTNLPASFVNLLLLASSLMALVVYLVAYQINFSRKVVKFLTALLIVSSIKRYFITFSNFILDTLIILRRSARDLFVLSVLTTLAYVSDAAIWYLLFVSLGSIQNFWAMLLGQLLSALTYLVPAAPGYIGSAEASGLLIFSGVLGIDANLASSMTVLFHILTLIFILIFGVVSVYLLKMDLMKIFDKIFRKN